MFKSFERLSRRTAGLPTDETLYDGAPAWLDRPFREWIESALRDDKYYARHVSMRLRLPSPKSGDYRMQLLNITSDQLVDAVDMVLQMHPGWNLVSNRYVGGFWNINSFNLLVTELHRILDDGSSMYKVDVTGQCLVRRVDETVQVAADETASNAPRGAAEHLKAAWKAAYGLDRDPDKVHNEAIRAVEEVACPLIEQKKAEAGKATLGTVIGELQNNSGHKWELVLPGSDGNPRGIDSLLVMFQTLWQSQVSRHGGSPKSRRATQEEGEAALHLAVLLVQWLISGSVRRKA